MNGHKAAFPSSLMGRLIPSSGEVRDERLH